MTDKYEIFEALGHGGMANVFRARDTDLERDVAIKELSAELAENERFVHLFLSEARKMASISHPNVLPIYAIDDDGQERPRLVMELAEGSLADQLNEGACEPVLVKRIGRQVLEGLEAIHQAGLVHRDIKPANIFYSRGFYKIADFGIATDGEEHTQLLATPKYMAPEVLNRPHLVGPASDLYSLGLILYEALVGSARFEKAVSHLVDAETGNFGPPTPAGPRKLIWRSFHGGPGELLAPHLLNSEIPEDLSLWVSKMIKKEICERFETCREAITTLDRGGTGGLPASYGAEMTQPVDLQAAKKGLSTLQVGILVVMVVMVLAGAGLLAWRHFKFTTVEIVSEPTGEKMEVSLALEGYETILLRLTPGNDPPPVVLRRSLPELPGDEAAFSASKLAEALTVFVSPSGRSRLTLTGARGARLRFGESLQFLASCPETAYAALFLLFSTGDGVLLYPNQRVDTLRLEASQETPVPLQSHTAAGYRLQASEPAGRDLAFLLTSRDRLPLPPRGEALGPWMTAFSFSAGDSGSPALALVRWIAAVRREKNDSSELVMAEILVEAGR